MAPKKKSGAAAHPFTSKAPPPAAAVAAGNAGAHEDVGDAGDVVGAGGVVTTSPMAEAGVGGTGEEQHQQHPSGHTPRGMNEGVIPSVPLPLTEGHSRSGGTRSGANRHPPVAPATGATAGRAPPLEWVDPATVPNGATGPQARQLHNHAIQAAGSQLRGRDAVAVGTVRSRATS